VNRHHIRKMVDDLKNKTQAINEDSSGNNKIAPIKAQLERIERILSESRIITRAKHYKEEDISV